MANRRKHTVSARRTEAAALIDRHVMLRRAAPAPAPVPAHVAVPVLGPAPAPVALTAVAEPRPAIPPDEFVPHPHNSRSGSANVTKGQSTQTVSVAGMRPDSLVLVTLLAVRPGVYVQAAVPGAGGFTVHLNKKAPRATKFAWIVLD